MGLRDIECFLHAATFGNHVLYDQDGFTGLDFESAAQDELAVFFLNKNEAHTQLAGDFLAKDEAAHSRRDDRLHAEVFHLFGKFPAKAFDVRHVLEREGALKILAAVQTATEHKVPFKQRARFPKNLQYFRLCHAGILKRGACGRNAS
jgi:hypothetical protein